MKTFDFINACTAPWAVLRFFTEDEHGNEKDLGSFFKITEIPEEILDCEIDSWAVFAYEDQGERIIELQIVL